MAVVVGPTNVHPDMASAPGLDGFAITPSDSTNFNAVAKCIWVGGAGNVALVTPTGTVLTFVGCLAGSILPVMSIRVNFTNTTATSLVGIM